MNTSMNTGRNARVVYSGIGEAVARRAVPARMDHRVDAGTDGAAFAHRIGQRHQIVLVGIGR
ncbi:hypothetical protein LAUMK191_01225 [Mycobacterium attenuatum]|uniref:Uncharacterized protein n=1 Tax=Mycobacterium attenuatum TaxID=2341086 RepID=A0A498PUV0_9MYCO|nr:hypothetical protein LAUMK136_01225 [Mycobacterium attenuatum]VBA48589.1 hypothetical protein LAUMK191_01225 [Mycobacterium attenuatum]VBA52973.1 hypothetical protein LAUMK41_01320 [Mycobacterium attenuatum]